MAMSRYFLPFSARTLAQRSLAFRERCARNAAETTRLPFPPLRTATDDEVYPPPSAARIKHPDRPNCKLSGDNIAARVPVCLLRIPPKYLSVI
jgi:hypothetical protein